MNIPYEELCETTQQQISQLLEHEQHLEDAQQGYAVTDIRTIQGKPVQLQDIQSDTLITVNGITGKVDDMIAAGIVSKSIYAGNFEDYLEDADAMFEVDEVHNDPEAYLIDDFEISNTVSQLEDVLGSATTIGMVSDVLAGNQLDMQALEELSESYGVSPERAQKEIESLTDSLMDSFEGYLNEQHQGIDINHLTQWVAYAANKNAKIMQMYQQAVTGALGGDLNYSRDLIGEYKKYYRLF